MMKTLIMLFVFCHVACAQYDGPPQRSWTNAYHFVVDTVFLAGATAGVTGIPPGSVIEHVHWRVDSTATNVDSLVLLMNGDAAISTCIPGVNDYTSSSPMFPVVLTTTAEIVFYGDADLATGQVRIVIVYRELI